MLQNTSMITDFQVELKRNNGWNAAFMYPQAIEDGKGVEECIEELIPMNPEPKPARTPKLSGKWKQIWTNQVRPIAYSVFLIIKCLSYILYLC